MAMFRYVLNKVRIKLGTWNFIWLGEGGQISSIPNFKSLLHREVSFLEPHVFMILWSDIYMGHSTRYVCYVRTGKRLYLKNYLELSDVPHIKRKISLSTTRSVCFKNSILIMAWVTGQGRARYVCYVRFWLFS